MDSEEVAFTVKMWRLAKPAVYLADGRIFFDGTHTCWWKWNLEKRCITICSIADADYSWDEDEDATEQYEKYLANKIVT